VKSYWRRHARAAIEAALASGWAQGLEGDDFKRHVDAAYPFGRHVGHGYLVWMEEYTRLVEGMTFCNRNPRLNHSPEEA
jgi:hypothetical protein